MTTSDNRLIVVRAWHDRDRLLIRLIVSAGPMAPALESVFSDIASATDRLAQVLAELQASVPGSLLDPPGEAETNR